MHLLHMRFHDCVLMRYSHLLTKSSNAKTKEIFINLISSCFKRMKIINKKCDTSVKKTSKSLLVTSGVTWKPILFCFNRWWPYYDNRVNSSSVFIIKLFMKRLVNFHITLHFHWALQQYYQVFLWTRLIPWSFFSFILIFCSF